MKVANSNYIFEYDAISHDDLSEANVKSCRCLVNDEIDTELERVTYLDGHHRRKPVPEQKTYRNILASRKRA
jgi:hypothetical protein